MAEIIVQDLERTEIYKLLIGSVLPRPIAWVTSRNENESINLAPYSAYNMVCSQPTTIAFSVGVKPDGSEKDTLRNIKREGEFVVNTPRPEHIEQVALSAAPFPYNSSEVERAGLKLTPATTVKAPRLLDAVFNLECRLQQLVQVGDGTPGSATLVLGTVTVIHVSDEIYSNGRIDFEKVSVLSRLGGYCYATLGKVLEQRVPSLP